MHEVMTHNFTNQILTLQISIGQKKLKWLGLAMIKLIHLTSSINGENKQNDQIALFLHMAQIASNGPRPSPLSFKQVLISLNLRLDHKISNSSSQIQQFHVHVMIHLENMI